MLNIKHTKMLCLTWGALTMAACDSHSNSSATTYNAPKPATGKSYRVVSEDVKPPLITYVSGKPTGFEYEILQAIAEKQGFTLQYDVSTRPLLLANVEQGKADIAAGAITINEERQQTVDFSDPILAYQTAVLVSKPLAQATSLAELKGKKIASRKGTVYEKMATEHLANPTGDNIRYYDTAWLQVKSLLTGNEEVLLGDSHILEYYIKQHGNEQVAFLQNLNMPTEYYGFAVKKGNTELQKQLNEGLAAIKADGTYGKIHQTYWAK